MLRDAIIWFWCIAAAILYLKTDGVWVLERKRENLSTCLCVCARARLQVRKNEENAKRKNKKDNDTKKNWMDKYKRQLIDQEERNNNQELDAQEE